MRLVAVPVHFLKLAAGISKAWPTASMQRTRAEKVLASPDSCFQHVRDLGCPSVPPSAQCKRMQSTAASSVRVLWLAHELVSSAVSDSAGLLHSKWVPCCRSPLSLMLKSCPSNTPRPTRSP